MIVGWIVRTGSERGGIDARAAIGKLMGTLGMRVEEVKFTTRRS
jgi:hypothetical protein